MCGDHYSEVPLYVNCCMHEGSYIFVDSILLYAIPLCDSTALVLLSASVVLQTTLLPPNPTLFFDLRFEHYK